MKHFTRALLFICMAFSTVNAGTECKDEFENCKLYESACFQKEVQENCPKTCKACDIIDYCENNNGNCVQICKSGDKEAICSCWDGYKLSEDKKDCEEYKLKVVMKKLKWKSARQHCVDNFGGDLIQHDPRLYTREGRQEISESLNLPIGHTYHTGIRRDNLQVWRRSSDGAEVQLEGWHPNGFPLSSASRKFLYWNFYNGSNKHMIYNSPDYSLHFICEY